jgi:glycosyltransferase involved in cell wall biosynthesis
MTDIEKAHHRALQLMQEKEYEHAKSALEKLSQTVEVKNDRAVCWYMLGDALKAIELLEEVLAEKKDYVPALINRKYIKLAIECEIKAPSFEIEEDSDNKVTSPIVSVIIPTYDRPQFLMEAISSVLAQSFQDFEIIVVNDGGPQDAKQIVFQINDPRIRYLRIKHGGISCALNAGLARSRGKYIAYLDDDDVYLPKHLINLVRTLEKQQNISLAYSSSFRCLQKQKNGEWFTYRKYVVGAQKFDRGALEKANFIQTTGCVMHRKALIDEVGGFNETIIGCQDWEFYLRATRKHQACFVDEATIEHRIREQKGTQLSGNYLVMRRNVAVTQYLHKLLAVLSDRLNENGYRRSLNSLARLISQNKSILDILDLYELTHRKPYACLFRLGKDLSLIGDKNLARRAFLQAFKLSPWEMKVWGRIIAP